MSDSADEHFSRDSLAQVLHVSFDQDATDRLLAHLRGCPDCGKLADKLVPPNPGPYPAGLVMPSPEAIDELGPDSPYQRVALLARRGTGNLYLARNRPLDRPAVLRTHRAGPDLTGANRESFLASMRSVARLNHPHIVSCHDAFERNGWWVLVTDYAPGMTLSEIFVERGILPLGEVTTCVLQVLDALEYASSRGEVHGDIKPNNIMIDWTHPEPSVTLLDFGLTAAVNRLIRPDPSLERITGSPSYMPPEAFRGGRRDDPRGDIYSLGCIYHRALVGRLWDRSSAFIDLAQARHNHDAPALAELLTDIPTGFSEVVARMLARSPADRYPNFAALAEALAPYGLR